ncbi:MAG TPA: hypothetical protein VLI69_06845 [Gammaproteobacteria bacterium]|nr:hypothetical protein [Gammaproteobacteria bacterium]
MSSVRRAMLNEENPALLPIAAQLTQGGLFAVIFGFLEKIFESFPLKAALFPTITILSAYKVYRNNKRYNRELNKNLGKRASITLDFLSLIAEITAVTLSLTGAAFISAATIPLIFGGMIAANFLSHAGQMLYHGYRWAKAWSGTKENEKHKAKFWGHTQATLGLGASLAGIVLLMVLPAAFGVVFTAAMVGTIKIAAASVVGGLNLTFAGFAFWKTKKQQSLVQEKNEAREIEKNEKRRVIFHDSKEITRPLLSSKNSQNSFNEAVPEKQNRRKVGFGEGPDADVLHEKYRTGFKGCFFSRTFNRLDRDDVFDLIRSLEASDDPAKLMRDFFEQAKNALEKPLGLHPGGIKLNEEGQLPDMKGSRWDLEFQKRYGKLHAVLLLERLLDEISKPADQQKKTSGGKPYINVRQGDSVIQMTSVKQIKDHFYYKQSGNDANIFTSLFKEVGCTQKLFVLADRYAKDPTLYSKEPLASSQASLIGNNRNNSINN